MTVTDAEARAARRRGEHLPQPLPVSALAEDRIVAGVPVRVFTPPEARGVYLHLHGGGFAFGSSRLQDDRLETLALSCRVAVASVEYRLAPEHPYPAGPDDCEAVAVRLVESGDPVCIGGESAGANLAVVTLVRMRDRHGFTGFRAACLVKGVYDLTPSPVAPADPGLAELDALVAAYAGGRDLAEPELSPLYADLRDLPPALVVVGDADPLLDDSLALAERWRTAGNECELAVVPDADHALEPAEQLHAFLTSRLDA
jgi:acetyl esterase/lipase